MNLADLEPQTMREQLVYTKQQRNRAVRACSLPPEILELIFGFAQDDWSPRGSPETIKANFGPEGTSVDTFLTKYMPGWMVILRVCSVWRQVRDDTSAVPLVLMSRPSSGCSWFADAME